MTDKVIVTGERHSGWATVAGWLGMENQGQAATPEAVEAWKKQPDKDQRWILVYASPEQALANALNEDRDNLSRVDALMEEWERSSTALLDFFQRNRKSGILINFNCLTDDPDAVVEHCNTLSGKSHQPEEDKKPEPDYTLIAQTASLLPNQDRLYRLYDEMQSAATQPGKDLDLAGRTRERLRQLARSGLEQALGEGLLSEEKARLSMENELLELQVGQLQEELESIYLEKQKQQQELDKLKHEHIEESQEKVKNLQRSLELTNQQIKQLQEELETYFIKSRTLEEKLYNLGNTDLHRRPGQFAVAESGEIIGAYDTEGYRDINIRLTDLLYSKGHRLENFTFKLILNDGQVGLEIRRKDNPDHDDLLEWPEDMQDEFGHFLVFLPQPPEGLRERQQTLRQTLSTHDRQLLAGVALALSDCFKRGAVSTELGLGGHDIRFWREKAAWLSSLMLSNGQYISTERVSLKEDHRSEGYAHLWVDCRNLQFGQAVESDYNFKVVITGDEHSLYYALEFRNQQDDIPPLHAWPTDYQDEWGPVALVTMTPHGEATYLNSEHVLPEHDRVFIAALAKKLPSILEELADQVEQNDEWQKWRTELTAIVANVLHWGEPPSSRLARIPVLRRFLKRR